MPTRRYPTDAMAAHLFGYVEEYIAPMMGTRARDFAIDDRPAFDALTNRFLKGSTGGPDAAILLYDTDADPAEMLPAGDVKGVDEAHVRRRGLTSVAERLPPWSPE